MDSDRIASGYTASDEVGDLLVRHPLFAACAPQTVAALLTDSHPVDFAAGEPLRRYGEPPVLCFLITGEASVYTPGDGSDCLLRLLRAGDVFGVADLFAPDGTTSAASLTRVTAACPTRALFFSEDTVRGCLTRDPVFAVGYIRFLADRIRFLNRRLTCLGAGSATRRLAAWLDVTVPEGADSCVLPLSLSRLPDALGLSRASLYRALDELEQDGYLLRSGKRVTLPDRAALRREFGLT